MSLQLLLYGDVGYDFSARSVAEALQGSKGPINVRISSGGGDAFDGLAIYSLLAGCGRAVTIDIDGLASSAASVIAMAGSPTRISEAALLFVHRSSTVEGGNAEVLQEAAAVLEKLDGAMLAVYARKTGRPPELIRPLMDAETWLTPEQALASGFVDEITGAVKIAAQVRTARSWTQIKDAVKAKLHAPLETATVVAMTPEEMKALLEATLAPFAARLAQLETPAPAPETEEPEEEPVVEVEETVENDAAAEVKALFAATVGAAFDNFVRAGQAKPASREHFVAASSSPAAFKATCALVEASAPVATAPTRLGPPAGTEPGTDPAADLTPAQREYAAKARINTSKWATKGTK